MVLTRDDVASLQDDNPKLDRLVARHEAWWHLKDADRPLLTIGRYPGLQPHPSGRTYYITLDTLPKVEDSIASLEMYFADHGVISGDIFRAVAPTGFPPMAEVIMGCACKVDSATNTYWLEALPGGWEQAKAITHETGREWVDTAAQPGFAECLYHQVRGVFPVAEHAGMNRLEPVLLPVGRDRIRVNALAPGTIRTDGYTYIVLPMRLA